MRYGMAYRPSFNGTHNRVKAKCLTELYHLKEAGEYKTETARELATVTGVNLNSLMVLLIRWNEWRYVRCDKSGPVKRYSLGSKGLAWLERWAAIIPDDIQ